MGVCQFHLNLIAAHPYLGNSFHSVSLPNSGSFHTYLEQFMSISDISDLKVRGWKKGQRFVSTWTPRVFALCKICIIWPLNGMDYCINWWSYLMSCALRCGISVLCWNCIFTEIWKYLSRSNMLSIMFIISHYVTFSGKNSSSHDNRTAGLYHYHYN